MVQKAAKQKTRAPASWCVSMRAVNSVNGGTPFYSFQCWGWSAGGSRAPLSEEGGRLLHSESGKGQGGREVMEEEGDFC